MIGDGDGFYAAPLSTRIVTSGAIPSRIGGPVVPRPGWTYSMFYRKPIQPVAGPWLPVSPSSGDDGTGGTIGTTGSTVGTGGTGGT